MLRECQSTILIRHAFDKPSTSGIAGFHCAAFSHARLSAAASASHVTGGQVERRNRVICPSGCLLKGLSSLFFGFSEKYLLPSDPNQI
jgi:hypothetical protein